MMNGLRGALGFLTVFPVPRSLEWQGAAMLPWFPVVGLIIGGLWTGFDALVGWAFSVTIRGGLDVLFLVFLTGGLHLDGLADTADGLLSHRRREEALRIMKDSRIGTWGVLALVSVLGLKTLALCRLLSQGKPLPMILIPAYGRVAMLAGIWLLPYGRGDEGIGAGLFQRRGRRSWIPGLVLLGLCSAVMDWPSPLVVNGTFVVSVALLVAWYRSRVGCVTGDMLGALGEVTETCLLIALAAG